MSEIVGSASRTLERTEAEQLVQHVADDALALVEAERRLVALPVEHAADQRANLRLGVLALDPGQAIEVEPVEQILVDAALQLLIGDVPGVRSRRSRFDRRRGSMTADNELTDQFLSLVCVPIYRRPERNPLRPPEPVRSLARAPRRRAREPARSATRTTGCDCRGPADAPCASPSARGGSHWETDARWRRRPPSRRRAGRSRPRTSRRLMTVETLVFG